MARAVTVGNGTLLVGLDACGQVRDLYYPYVGEANHVSGASGNHVHRVGVWVDGDVHWLSDPSWRVTIDSCAQAGVGRVRAEHGWLGIVVESCDAVHNEHNVFVRQFTVTNIGDEQRAIKLMLAQQFRIYENSRGDTGYYDPRVGAIVHYKGDVTLLVNATSAGQQFAEYTIGLFGIEGKQGAWQDAADGNLQGNPIEHGSVDSILALPMTLAAGQSQTADYWVVCAESIPAAHKLNQLVLEDTPADLVSSTAAYWDAWLQKEARDLSMLPAAVQQLFRQSLITMRVHADNHGGIIASSDTDMLHHGRDTYSYVWPRDGAIVAHVFDQAGYRDISRQFFSFMQHCQEPDGYLMHKYRSDGVLGSSWHPWVINGEARLPIQEDETASLLFVLWKHYEQYKDVEFVESLYNSFIEPAAEFMVGYVDPSTGLPQPSFDLWEEKYGTSTYTAASVYAGLTAAARFAQLLGKDDASRAYGAVAERMQKAIDDVLFNRSTGSFVKQVTTDAAGSVAYDLTVDVSSLHGLLFFEVFAHDDERIVQMVQTVEKVLLVPQVGSDVAGCMRYEGDNYYRQHDDTSPNPWIICTLWLARYYIATAPTRADLARPLAMLEWVECSAGAGGALAEQLQPETGAHLSASPLVWSHAEFVLTTLRYMEKWEELGE